MRHQRRARHASRRRFRLLPQTLLVVFGLILGGLTTQSLVSDAAPHPPLHGHHPRPHPPRPAPAPTRTPHPTSSPTVTPTATPTPTPTKTTPPSTSGTLPADASNLAAGTYTVRDFTSQDSGAVLDGTLKGAGQTATTVEMVPGSSTKAADVPADGSGATNPYYLLRGVTDLEDVTVQGTEQGHLYGGLYMTGANLLMRDVAVNDIPGDSNEPPGETSFIGVNHATGTNTVDNVTLNGGSGDLAGAAGLEVNNSDSDWNITDFTANGLKYSAGIALWQVHGTFNIHDYVQTGGARSLGAERMAGTVNLYDPQWSAGTIGHDVTYTWAGGYTGGSINFVYSSAAKVPDRKIVVVTNGAAGIAASVTVTIAGVRQDAAQYVTVTG